MTFDCYEQCMLPNGDTSYRKTGEKYGLVPAVATVFPEAKHAFCQMHYLKNAAEPVAEADQAMKVTLQGGAGTSGKAHPSRKSGTNRCLDGHRLDTFACRRRTITEVIFVHTQGPRTLFWALGKSLPVPGSEDAIIGFDYHGWGLSCAGSDQRSSTLFHVFRGDNGDTWGLFRSFAADYAYATSRRQYLACTRHPKSEQSVRNKAPPVLNVLSDKSAHAIPWA